MDNASVHHANTSAVFRDNIELKNRKKKSILRFAIAVIAIAVIVFAGLVVYKSSTGSNIDGSKYQAVFLTNGQVYFGKLTTLNSDYLKLSNIYYLQAKTTTKSTSTDSSTLQSSSNSSSDVELVKLGSELHGPTDEMLINKDQILFFENLKVDGKVSASIAQFIKNKAATK